MRILLINPNMTVGMTEKMTAIARSHAGDGVEIVPLTASRGFPYIASRAEAQIAGALVLEMIAAHRTEVDAVIIAAFGDPGLAGARELFDLPVVGMAEAAILSAAMLGDTFSIVTFSPLMTRWYSDSVAQTGLTSRFRGVRTPQRQDLDLSRIGMDMRAELIRLSAISATEDGADVVILGGAPLAGLASDIGPEVPAVVVDPIAAATVQAVALARLGAQYGARANRPASKSSVGLDAPLAQVIGEGAGQ